MGGVPGDPERDRRDGRGALPGPGRDGRGARTSGRPTVDLLDFDPDGEDKVIAAIVLPLRRPPRGRGARGSRRLGPRSGGPSAGLRRRAGQPAPSSGSGLRAHRLPLRHGHGLRRVPRSPTPPDADDRVAAARRRPWARRSRVGRRGRAASALRRVDGTIAPSCTRCCTRLPGAGAYAVALAFSIRYSMQMNAREAMHVLELRAGRRGIRATAGWPRRCTGRSPSGPGTGSWPRRCRTSTSARGRARTARVGTPGRASGNLSESGKPVTR